jgi:hypothetical protein
MANIDLKKILLLRGKNIFTTFAKFVFTQFFVYNLRKDSLHQGVPKRQSEILPIKNPS